MRIVFITIVFVAFALTSCGNKTTLRSAVPNQTLAASEQLPIDTEKQTDELATTGRLAIRYFGVGLEETGYRVTWSYFNPGDYNLDGIVAVDDITPLVQHWGDGSNYWDWLDTSNDGLKSTADLTALAMYSNTQVTGYRIEGAATTDGPWEELATVDTDQMEVTDSTISFNAEIPLGSTYLRIVTETSEGDAGVSEPHVVPSKEPKIYSVTPTEAVVGEPAYFRAEVTGEWTRHYYWTFSGAEIQGETWREDVAKVVYSHSGTYDAKLKVTNRYGETEYDFNVTVSERDTWARGWSLGSRYDTYPVTLCVDTSENVWTLTDAHGWPGTPNCYIVHKWDPDGTLLGTKSLVIEGVQGFKAIVSSEDGGVIILSNGYYETFDVGITAIKLSSTMSLEWAHLLDFKYVSYVDDIAATATKEGGFVLTTSYSNIMAFESPNVMTALIDRTGHLVWARKWSSGIDNIDEATVTIDEEGNVYTIAHADESNYFNRSIVILKYDTTGRLVRSLSFEKALTDAAVSAQVIDDSLYITGSTLTSGVSGADGLIVKLYLKSLNADYATRLIVGGVGADVITGVCRQPSGRFLACGYSSSGLNSSDSFGVIYEFGAEYQTQDIWTKRAFGYWFSDVAFAQDGSLYTAGATDYSGVVDWAYWDANAIYDYEVLKTKVGTDGSVTCNSEDLSIEETELEMYYDVVYGRRVAVTKNFPSSI